MGLCYGNSNDNKDREFSSITFALDSNFFHRSYPQSICYHIFVITKTFFFSILLRAKMFVVCCFTSDRIEIQTRILPFFLFMGVSSSSLFSIFDKSSVLLRFSNYLINRNHFHWIDQLPIVVFRNHKLHAIFFLLSHYDINSLTNDSTVKINISSCLIQQNIQALSSTQLDFYGYVICISYELHCCHLFFSLSSNCKSTRISIMLACRWIIVKYIFICFCS